MDTWWNSAVENQAIDRIHRFGQTREVRALSLSFLGRRQPLMPVAPAGLRHALPHQALDRRQDDRGALLSHLARPAFLDGVTDFASFSASHSCKSARPK